jgi:hypothetical protein
MIRSVRLLGIAAEAEILRLKREAGSMARSLVFQMAAGFFGLVVLGLLHAAAWIWLAEGSGGLLASLYVAAGDAVVMGVLLVLARRRTDPVAHDALMVRQRALAEAKRSLPLVGLLRRN